MASLKFINKLRGARVLVVGGTSGIGFGVAEAVIEHGARVVISGSNPDKLSDAVSKLKETFNLVHNSSSSSEILTNGASGSDSKDLEPSGHECDLSDSKTLEDNLKKLLKFATNNGANKLNHVVFTSGDGFEARKLPEVDPDHIARAFLIRATASVILAKLLLPEYVHHEAASSFTITGGVNGEKPEPNWTIPAGFSTAIEGYTHGLAVDLKPMRVNCVAPGVVYTNLIEKTPIDKKEKILETFRSATLTDSVGTPEDLAEAYLYCMRDRFVTGSTIKSNGGRLLV